MFRKVLIFTALIFSISALAETRAYVNTVEDFYMHMKNHVENVGRIADKVLEEMEKDPAKWRKTFGIPANVPIDDKLKKQVRAFIALHDESKLNTTQSFLKKLNRKNGIINDLFSIYGKTFASMSDEEKNIVNGLNGVDAEVRAKFIKDNGLPDWVVRVMDEVEKIADGVERGMNPVTAEEMAKKVWKESEAANNKLAQALKEGSDANEIARLRDRLEMIKKMETSYPKDTVHFNAYRDRMRKLQFSLRESGIFSEYLDEFASYRLIDDIENSLGQKLDPSDSQLVKKLKAHFFQNKKGLAILKSSIPPSTRNEANIMLELGSYELNPAQEGKWKNLYKAFEGMCEI
jgi:hypothetical protein